MYSILAITKSEEADDVLTEVGKCIRTLGPSMGLGDCHQLIDRGNVRYPCEFILLEGYSARHIIALTQLEVTARVISRNTRRPTSTLYMFYGKEFINYPIDLLDKRIPNNHKPYARMPMSKLTGDPHDLVLDHILSLSGADLDTLVAGTVLPCPVYNCLSMRLDVADLYD